MLFAIKKSGKYAAGYDPSDQKWRLLVLGSIYENGRERVSVWIEPGSSYATRTGTPKPPEAPASSTPFGR